MFSEIHHDSVREENVIPLLTYHKGQGQHSYNKRQINMEKTQQMYVFYKIKVSCDIKPSEVNTQTCRKNFMLMFIDNGHLDRNVIG
jgi:hypothetical protein